MKSGIYQILNKVNGKSYVGSAVDLRKRWNKHYSDLCNEKHNPHLQSAWNKYGKEAFQFNVLEYVQNTEWLIEIEQYWIDFLETANRDFGYNACPVADNCLGMKHSELTKKKMSESGKNKIFTQDHKKHISDAHRGKILTDDHKRKLSNAKIGKTLSEETKRKIGESQKGKIVIVSEEAKKKMSDTKKGKPSPMLGKKHSEETKRKISKTKKNKGI
jgi:group I intron endonuclease